MEEEKHEHEEDAGESIEEHAETHVHAGESQAQECHPWPGFYLDAGVLLSCTIGVTPLLRFRSAVRRWL